MMICSVVHSCASITMGRIHRRWRMILVAVYVPVSSQYRLLFDELITSAEQIEQTNSRIVSVGQRCLHRIECNREFGMVPAASVENVALSSMKNGRKTCHETLKPFRWVLTRLPTDRTVKELAVSAVFYDGAMITCFLL